MKAKKLIFLLLILPIILAGLGVGGFYAYNEMQGQHAQNLKELEKFGFTVLPTTVYEESKGELGENQLPSTFAEDKLTPTQKVIRGLMDDNDELIEETKELRQQISMLKDEIAALENYKQLNEHFAPLTIAEELTAVEKQLKDMLVDMPDARRFSNLQIEAMSAASANEYKKFISNRRIILSDKEREDMVAEYMPEFAFCAGDGIEIAANSPREANLITEHFRDQSKSRLDGDLKSDLETVIKPCQTALYERLASYDRPL